MTTPAADGRTEDRDTFPLLAVRAATGPTGRPIARRNTASGRPIAGPRSPTRSAGWRRAGRSGLPPRRPPDRGRRHRPRLYWSMCAAQSLGGVPVPVYQDLVADELAYVVDHAGARFAIAENQSRSTSCGDPARCRPRGRDLRRPARPAPLCRRAVHEAVQQRGAERLRAEPNLVDAEVAQGAARRRHHALHLGHHRTAEGRGAELRQPRGRRRPAPSSTACARATSSSRTCRWPGSATTSSLRPGASSGWSSTARNRPAR